MMTTLPMWVSGQTDIGPEYIPPRPEHALPMWLNPPKEAKMASCAVDVGLATVFLGHAGTSINAAVRSCERQKTAMDKAACSASISGVVLGFGYAAGFLSAAAADCHESLQVVDKEAVTKAACAADVATFLASLALLANSGSTLRNTCGNEIPEDFDRLSDSTRRLQQGNATALRTIITKRIKSPFEAGEQTLIMRSGEISECVFDVGQATLFFARAGLMINAAVADCSRFELRTGGSEAQAKCSVDVSSVVASFAFTASGISYACFHCPFWKTVQPACAGAIINLISALSEIAAVASSFEATCGHKGRRLLAVTETPGVLV